MLKRKPSFTIDVFPQLVVSLENSLDMHLGLDLDMHPKSRTENLDPGQQDVIWPLIYHFLPSKITFKPIT